MSKAVMEKSRVEARVVQGVLARCNLCKASGPMKVLLEESGKRLLRCSQCQVAFLHPQPTLRELTDDFVDRHITNEERLQQMYGPRRDPVLKAVADWVAREAPGRGKILDVGCGGGDFLDKFLDQDRWEKFGAEPSRFASQAAGKKGIKVWQGMFASLELPGGFFDVITILDTFMYFPHPQAELSLVRKVLKPSGTLWIEVPLGEARILHNNSLLAALFGRFSQSVFHSSHLFYYNFNSLSYVLKEAGFHLAWTAPIPASHHANFFADLAFRSYYCASKLCWHLSFHRHQLGPNILVKAVPRT